MDEATTLQVQGGIVRPRYAMAGELQDDDQKRQLVRQMLQDSKQYAKYPFHYDDIDADVPKLQTVKCFRAACLSRRKGTSRGYGARCQGYYVRQKEGSVGRWRNSRGGVVCLICPAGLAGHVEQGTDCGVERAGS